MALVSLDAVRKSFGSRTVLDGLDFTIEPCARVGANGLIGLVRRVSSAREAATHLP